MRLLHVVSISTFLLLVSCQTAQKTEAPRFNQSFSLVEKKLTLETVIANWDQMLADTNRREPAQKVEWLEELHRMCMKQDNLCEYNVKSPKKRDDFNKKVIAEIKKNIEEENFEVIKNYSIELGLRFFARYKKNALMDFADNLLRDNECRSSDFKHALASTLEDFLPNLEVKEAVQELYESNSQCPTSKTTAMSSYRAAMLRLVDQDCLKATPLLEKVTSSSEDYLKPRSLYWTWRCRGQSTEVSSAANALLPYFSYHRILMDEASAVSPDDIQLLADVTPTMTETKKNENLNEVARLAERLIAIQMTPAARAVLEKIRLDRVQETEPEFQVYWARLLHLTQAGIKKFQILASLINTYPQFRSKTIQNMLFPKSFFETVEARSKKLDPWLVQSLIRQESAFDPQARSRVGATGLMQLMPSTARRIVGMRGQLKDPDYNLHAGIKFLENLVNRFDGEVHFALAAYNAGPGKVDEWQKRYPTQDPLLFIDTIPYRETREYVAFILRNYHWYRSLNPTPATETVHTEPQSTLSRMAIQIDSF